jgi:hypothetical protein
VREMVADWRSIPEGRWMNESGVPWIWRISDTRAINVLWSGVLVITNWFTVHKSPFSRYIAEFVRSSRSSEAGKEAGSFWPVNVSWNRRGSSLSRMQSPVNSE